MDNRGQITVFLCLLLTSMLLIGLTALEMIRINTGKAKFSQASKGAMENLKAGYSRELFEAYHLLLLDKNCNGQGEAGLETLTKEYLDYTLGEDDFLDMQTTDVILTGTVDILQEECAPLKNQITEYMKLYSEVTAVTELADLVMNASDASDEAQNAVEAGRNEMNDKDSDWSGDDPRDVLKDSTSSGLLSIVTPDGTAPSKDKFDKSDFPSKNRGEEEDDIVINLEDIDILEEQLGTSNSECLLNLQENYYGIAYAIECFDFYTSQKNYDNRMKCEVEYLICGKDNDYDNLSSV
ncbi:MAG: DUF5702 domain-containing protein, partial [Coprococcus sp.]